MKAQDYFTEERLARIDSPSNRRKTRHPEGRLYVEDRCKEDVLDVTAFPFGELEMHKTELRNGVLFYLAIRITSSRYLVMVVLMPRFRMVFGIRSKRPCLMSLKQVSLHKV